MRLAARGQARGTVVSDRLNTRNTNAVDFLLLPNFWVIGWTTSCFYSHSAVHRTTCCARVAHPHTHLYGTGIEIFRVSETSEGPRV